MITAILLFIYEGGKYLSTTFTLEKLVIICIHTQTFMCLSLGICLPQPACQEDKNQELCAKPMQ